MKSTCVALVLKYGVFCIVVIESNTMNSKSVRSAVIIQPPLDQWPQIQEFREKFDKAFIRWMPHINL